jgi:hypothetical protein
MDFSKTEEYVLRYRLNKSSFANKGFVWAMSVKEMSDGMGFIFICFWWIHNYRKLTDSHESSKSTSENASSSDSPKEKTKTHTYNRR